MKFTDDQLAAAGFQPQPNVYGAYTRQLGNGNLQLLDNAGENKTTRFVNEYYKTQKAHRDKLVTVYFLEQAQDLADIAAGTCKNVLLRRS